jgi:hypothetical protein
MTGGPIDPSEKKALLIALIPCLLFIAFLTVLNSPASRTQRQRRISHIQPAEIPNLEQFHVEEPVVKEWHQPSTVVPENFELVDFENRSYGRYKFSDGTTTNLTLTNGEYQVADTQYYSTFSLKHVYYADLTGDRSDEAIVLLARTACPGCDGGSHLLYIYTGRNSNLRTLWQYETGSLNNGCGLNGLTMNRKQFLVALFGRCPQQGLTADSGQENGTVHESTFILYEFNGRRFVQKSIEVVPVGSVDVIRHEPEIRIYDSPQKPVEVKGTNVSLVFSTISTGHT